MEKRAYFFITIIIVLCTYAFILHDLIHIVQSDPRSSIVTAFLMAGILLFAIILIRLDGGPLKSYGLTFDNTRKALKEGIIFTIPLLLLMLLLKIGAVNFISDFKDKPVFALEHAILGASPQFWWTDIFLYSFVISPFQVFIARGVLQQLLIKHLPVKYNRWAAILVQRGNPCPEGKVRGHRLCHVTDYLLHPDLSCPYDIRKGVTNEPISKIITNDLVLPISYTLDTEIQIPNHGRSNS